MAVTMMCKEDEVGAVASSYKDVFVKESYTGCVLFLRERNGYDDSDFLATVWSFVSNRPIEIEYASTRGWCYPNNAVVDATEEVKALYAAYQEKARAEYKAQMDALKACVPAKGSKVLISLSRGKNKALNGLIGEVFWIGADSYAPYYAPWYQRVGVMVNEQKVYLSDNNVTVEGQSLSARDAQGKLIAYSKVGQI